MSGREPSYPRGESQGVVTRGQSAARGSRTGEPSGVAARAQRSPAQPSSGSRSRTSAAPRSGPPRSAQPRSTAVAVPRPAAASSRVTTRARAAATVVVAPSPTTVRPRGIAVSPAAASRNVEAVVDPPAVHPDPAAVVSTAPRDSAVDVGVARTRRGTPYSARSSLRPAAAAAQDAVSPPRAFAGLAPRIHAPIAEPETAIDSVHVGRQPRAERVATDTSAVVGGLAPGTVQSLARAFRAPRPAPPRPPTPGRSVRGHPVDLSPGSFLRNPSLLLPRSGDGQNAGPSAASASAAAARDAAALAPPASATDAPASPDAGATGQRKMHSGETDNEGGSEPESVEDQTGRDATVSENWSVLEHIVANLSERERRALGLLPPSAAAAPLASPPRTPVRELAVSPVISAARFTLPREPGQPSPRSAREALQILRDEQFSRAL